LYEFAKQNAKAPDIHRETISALSSKENLRGCVSQCTAVGSCAELLILMKHFWKAKVDQLDISIFVYHHVFRFDISINYIVPHKCLQGTKDLWRIKLDPTFLGVFAKLHVHLILYHPVKILAWEIFEDEVNIFVVRKGFL